MSFEKEFDITMANSVMAVAEMAKASEVLKEKKRLEEVNSPTNENLRTIIKQNHAQILQSEEKIKLLTEQNENLKKQLASANKDSKRNRIGFYITTFIALASLVATILIAILKQLQDIWALTGYE